MEKNRGFIRTILLLIIALAALKYVFGWSIFDAIESESGKETVAYIRQILDLLWSYLEAPVNYIWKEVILPAFTKLFSNIGN